MTTSKNDKLRSEQLDEIKNDITTIELLEELFCIENKLQMKEREFITGIEVIVGKIRAD